MMCQQLDLRELSSMEMVWSVDEEIEIKCTPKMSPKVDLFNEPSRKLTVTCLSTNNMFSNQKEHRWSLESICSTENDDPLRHLHFLAKDKAYYFHSDYMAFHPDLNYQMRVMLIDWMIDVSVEFLLHRETLHLSISLVDRYLSATSNFPRKDFQTLGVSALFIAAKIEEIHPPKMHQFVAVCDGACSSKQIESFEMAVLFVFFLLIL